MSIENWRTRTPEEKEELRSRIMQLLQDNKPRNYKEIEQELGISHVCFELDRLIHLEEIFRFAMPQWGQYSYYKVNSPYFRSIIYVENEENKITACYVPYSKADY
jgi:hypothetical protein